MNIYAELRTVREDAEVALAQAGVMVRPVLSPDRVNAVSNTVNTIATGYQAAVAHLIVANGTPVAPRADVRSPVYPHLHRLRALWLAAAALALDNAEALNAYAPLPPAPPNGKVDGS